MKNANTNQQKRRGWTLIEMTVIISLLSTFSFVGISLINKLMELDSTLAATAFQQMTIDRFADQLRADADASTEVEEVDNGFNLTENTGAVIEYRILDNLITRKIQRAHLVARDSFQFDNCELSFKVSPQQIEFVIEKFEPLAEKSMSSQLRSNNEFPARLLISIGRHQRYAVLSPSDGEEQ